MSDEGGKAAFDGLTGSAFGALGAWRGQGAGRAAAPQAGPPAWRRKTAAIGARHLPSGPRRGGATAIGGEMQPAALCSMTVNKVSSLFTAALACSALVG